MTTATRRTQEELLAADKLRAERAATKLRIKFLTAKSKAMDNIAERARLEKWRGRRGAAGGAGGGGGRTAAPEARYDNATRTRLRPGPRAMGGSAQSHLMWSKRLLRIDCQDAGRNSLVGRTLIKASQDAVVGDGPVVTSLSENEAFNDLADELFNAWAEGCESDDLGHPDVRGIQSFWEICRGVDGAWATDGDALIVKLANGALQVIESELIVNPTGAPGVIEVPEKNGGGSIVDGVQQNTSGRPLFFHLGRWAAYGNAVLPDQSDVAAEDCYWLPNPVDFKTGMVRGEPGLQAAVSRIERLDNFIDKTGLMAEIQTLFGAAIKTNAPDVTKKAMEDSTPDQPSVTDADTTKEVTLQAANILHLAPGEDLVAIEPKAPGPNFRDFVFTNLMLIGGDIGVPVPLAWLDATGLSWSNIKAILAMAWTRVRTRQSNLSSRMIRPERKRQLERWADEGLFAAVGVRDAEGLDSGAKGWQKAQVVMPCEPVLDIKTEAEGLAILKGQNMMTLDQCTQRLGTGRAKDVIKARGVERRLEEAAGVVPSALPGAKSESGNTAGADGAADPAQQKVAA